ncbi:MAG TPA: hypothetical protein VL944_00245 [Candidatus Acidoferrum sp.]|nr:hypothetical protein [Candidatus Acidoferrum sp.]
MARSRTGSAQGAFALEFLGGLFFLITAAVLINMGATGFSGALGAWNAGIASFWLPLIFPAAILGSITVFLLSFANLTSWGGRAAGMTGKLTWFAAASLLLMTVGTAWMWLVIVGFVFSIIGSAVSMKQKM